MNSIQGELVWNAYFHKRLHATPHDTPRRGRKVYGNIPNFLNDIVRSLHIVTEHNITTEDIDFHELVFARILLDLNDLDKLVDLLLDGGCELSCIDSWEQTADLILN